MFIKKILLTITILLLVLPNMALAHDIKIFILHSYQQEYPWTKNEHHAFVDSLLADSSLEHLVFSSESLDSKRRAFTGSYQNFFYQYLKEKYQGYQPALIFCTDDNALQFLLEYKTRLFRGAPVVFCGVNNLEIKSRLNRQMYGGVFEKKDIAQNVELISRLHPDGKNIYFVGDNSSTSISIEKEAQKVMASRFPGLQYEVISHKNISPVIGRLQDKEDGVVLLTSIGAFQDQTNNTLPLKKIIHALAENNRHKIYSMEDVYILNGAVGGYVTSGTTQGEAAARMAATLLKSPPPNTPIPLIDDSPNVLMFNYPQLQRHNISVSSLPPDSIIINSPETFYARHKTIIRQVLSFIVLLLAIIALLARNIMLRKKSAALLKEQINLFESTFNSVPDGMILTDADNLILKCNPAMGHIFGFDQDEIRGRNSAIFLQEKSPAKQIEEPNGLCKSYTTSYQRKNGDLFPAETIETPITDHVGNFLGHLHEIRDISSRKTLEEKLRQAQKMESIGTLAGGIAHDLNNILTPILGYAELLYEDLQPNSPHSAKVSEVIKAGNRAKELVKQILTFSRQNDQERIAVNIAPLVKEALKLLRSSIPSTIKINQNINPQCGQILADPTQIYQIVMNLCTNAYHAMRSTEGVLRVSLTAKEITAGQEAHGLELEPGNYLVLEVCDTGHGIDQRIMAKIFDPYFTTKKIGEGTGMGLSVVHAIVQEYGGNIKVHSEAGKGTTFNVYLPLLDKEAPAEQTEAGVEIPRGSGRIMTVDDEKANVIVQELLLKNLGYQVTTFTSSGKALAEFNANPDRYDLVITDMTMPEMTGAELTTKLLAIRPELPVIMCTGFSEMINEQRAKELGVREFIMKPVTRSDIAKIIKKVLTSKKISAIGPAPATD
ncbi:MAG: response regulator [Desulfobulbaceae bacterium]|nr:response regulator [Desulfobulbaceae bacterium]